MSEGKEKFTPGPWSNAHLSDRGCKCGYVFAENGVTVAKVLYNDVNESSYSKYGEELPLPVARANAALIAAAPDMYAALRNSLADMEQIDEICKIAGVPPFSMMRAEIASVLAKARGESV